MKIFLVGLPGSGKSTIGKSLAKKLENFYFIDMDEEIVRSEGKSVETIFREDGEDYFRKAEQRTLVKLSTLEDSAIIATGGGAPCFFNNMDIINHAGISIYINPPLEMIVSRLQLDKKNKRPLLQKKSMEEKVKYIEEKYRERNPFYSKAQMQFKDKNLKPETILEKLKSENLF